MDLGLTSNDLLNRNSCSVPPIGNMETSVSWDRPLKGQDTATATVSVQLCRLPLSFSPSLFLLLTRRHTHTHKTLCVCMYVAL